MARLQASRVRAAPAPARAQASSRNDAQAAEGDASPRLESLPPVIGPDTRLVVLGSFPGVASLHAQAYYAHPRNQFWPLLSVLLAADFLAMPYAERLATLLQRGLGLWDVYRECRRVGSLDSAIRDAELNDLSSLRERAPGLCGIAHNGGESVRSMRQTAGLGLPVWALPSSSPANASWSFERKLAAWRQAFEAAGVLR
jgi:hypoxanthine-DNA glycosylase